MAMLLGRVAEVWRYPVKSMAGEALREGRLVRYGLEGDRLFAFESDAAPPGMLRMSGVERRAVLGFGARTVSGGVEVETPGGECFGVESEELLRRLPAGLRLKRAETPQTDVRALALIGIGTVAALGEEMGAALDGARFRANLVLDLEAGAFSEDGLAGRVVRLGAAAKVLVKERTPRCRVVTYEPGDPVEVEPLFGLMKVLDRRHQGRAGVYGVVAAEGVVRVGDRVWVES